VVVIYLLPHYHVYLWGLLGVGSAAAVVTGIVRNRPAHPIAWLCVALALTTFASGDITYHVETEFFHQVNPVALPCLQALKGLGLRLAVDDFGTGYSSLSYLADLPISVVKIDKSFIDRITRDADGVAMVRGLIDLSRALGLTCTAEGVERDNQLAVLDDLGCESVQGYLFAKPTSAVDAAEAFAHLAQGQPTATALLPAT